MTQMASILSTPYYSYNKILTIQLLIGCILLSHVEKCSGDIEPKPNYDDPTAIMPRFDGVHDASSIDTKLNNEHLNKKINGNVDGGGGGGGDGGGNDVLANDNEKGSMKLTELGFLHAFIASLSVIVVSELGDKTFFIAAIMAMRHPRLTVFTGAITALALMTILSAVFGIAATIIPRVYTYYISTALFAIFGLKMLKDGYYMSPTDAQEELEEVQSDLRKREDELLKSMKNGGGGASGASMNSSSSSSMRRHGLHHKRRRDSNENCDSDDDSVNSGTNDDITVNLDDEQRQAMISDRRTKSAMNLSLSTSSLRTYAISRIGNDNPIKDGGIFVNNNNNNNINSNNNRYSVELSMLHSSRGGNEKLNSVGGSLSNGRLNGLSRNHLISNGVIGTGVMATITTTTGSSSVSTATKLPTAELTGNNLNGMELKQLTGSKKRLEKEVSTTLVQDPESGVIRKTKPPSAAYLASRIFMQAFTMTFLAEWGDRSQLTTIILSAREDVYGVIVGGVLGHSLCTGLAVLGGRMIAQKISVRTVTLIGGVVFLLFAISALFMNPNEEETP